VLTQLQLSEVDRSNFIPSSSARVVRDFLECSFDRYISVVALLAVAEQEVILFTPALRRAVAKLGINVDDGYYFVHGISDDDTANASDDYHENDLWHVLTQAITVDDYESISAQCMQYMDMWVRFWDRQAMLMNEDADVGINVLKETP
jgi:hypothetical protein